MPDSSSPPVRSVLRHLDAAALRAPTRKETRARQRHLPPISVYRWWARRTETVTGALVDALSTDQPGRLLVADTFAGGGVIALAALRRGHQVYAQDVNPWAARSLATMLDLPPADEIAAGAERLHAAVDDVLATAYATVMADGSPGTITHTLRVATAPCPSCADELRLFPSALVSLTARVDCGSTSGYLACPAGHLSAGPATKRSACTTCGRYVKPAARYTANRSARCVSCGWKGKLAQLSGVNGFRWGVALVERAAEGRREVAPPTPGELAVADDRAWDPQRQLPAIASGVETSVLLRHGMRHWHDLYPARQRVVVEALLDACPDAAEGDDRLERALLSAVVGSTEMAGRVSRWDARYLKPYEAVANHRYNFTTLSAEPNVWGAKESGRGTVTRRIDQLQKASIWLEEQTGKRLTVKGPKPATSRRTAVAASTDAVVVAGSSERLCVPDNSLSAVLTDPPYHDDVHYAELSDLFRAWAGEATGTLDGDAIVRRHTGTSDGTAAYEQLLTSVFRDVHRALKPGGHLVLSYANRTPAAWAALFGALQSAGFRTVGYTVVHSENEVDHAKAGRRACNLDVLLDLVDADLATEQFRPCIAVPGDEGQFCQVVGDWALKIGGLPEDWASDFTSDLRDTEFLT